MPKKASLLLVIAMTAAAAGAAQAQSAWSRVLDAYVVDGGVRYGALARDRAELDAYLRELASVTAAEFDAWPRADRVAYLINAYNAYVIAEVLDHYPIRRSLRPAALVRPGDSVWQIDGFFDAIEHRAAGRTLTLDAIEHEWLRARYREPRIHAALVCAAESCPPLRAEPYTGAALDAQLDDQMRRFLLDPSKNRFDPAEGVVALSSIFDWFGEDFAAHAPERGFASAPEGRRGALAFVARYLPPELAGWLRDGRYTLRFLDYDWSLNER